MPNDTETDKILEAVAGVRGDVSDVRDSVRCLDGKVGELRIEVTGHLAEHKGAEKAEAKAATEGAQTSAKVKAVGAWVKIGMTALAMLVTALIFVLSGIGAADDRPSDVQALSAKIDNLVDAMETSRLARTP